ncbi:MAG: 4'-phosphopantetheinyl transferase superfamily protein [Candidatus Omnitrophica bacterium]|nr:4'-phosphopantetheinyl transferase superfamily protein [Candidatus Omnitrophota bacterium]MCM8806390.1 4'-phosphopantetheinyl transferase superfamily protein [Candidatus Omnitrophota bacterium]
MKARLGIDILEIERFRKSCEKYGIRFLKKIFSTKEIENMKDDYLKFSIAFSFKESIWKALPDEIQKNYSFKKLKILFKEEKPILLTKIKNYKILMSYSQTGKYILTIVLLLRN